MKKFRVLILVIAVALSNSIFAGTNPKTNGEIEKPIIAKEISDLLKNPSFEVKQEVMVITTVTLNKNNEIVVLSVDTENETMSSYIKSRLNYKALSKNSTSGLNQIFTIPVKFTSNTI